MNKEYFTITADGVEHTCRILFTHHSDEYNKNYVVFVVEKTNELSAMIYNETDENSGSLLPIENDDEWEMMQECLNEWFEENPDAFNDSCGCSCGSCDGGCHDHENECCEGDCDDDCDCHSHDHDCCCHHE